MVSLLAQENHGARCAIGNFAHKAVYNTNHGRIEMHLECIKDHRVHINGNVYTFTSGETIHTESFYKYSVNGFHTQAAKAGFTPVRVWIDEAELFSIHYLKAL